MGTAKKKHYFGLGVLALLGFVAASNAWAGMDGSVAGTVLDPQGVAVSGVTVKITAPSGVLLKQTQSSMTGDFQFGELTIGDYGLSVDAPGFAPFHSSIHVGSVGVSQAEVQLQPAGSQEMVLKVEAKRHLVQDTSSTSSATMDKEQIAKLPEGDDISLPKLLESTTAGIVQGPFNQMFIRGNHANVQYQIDGVQLPDSVSGTFAEAFSVKNIEHYEIITGGLPAEYGERDAAVVNIVTKTGGETPSGSVELNYGSYDTFAPKGVISGSNKDGDIHYFLSAGFDTTERGLDTPDPESVSNQSQGGSNPVHDDSNGNNEFMKIDWLPDNSNKVSLILYQNYNFYQIPNFPANFAAQATSPGSPGAYFGNNYNDQFGNSPAAAGAPLFIFTPTNTNDTQANQDMYAQAVWKHTYSEKSFLQIAPYWKYSKVRVTNDPINDLITATPSSNPFYNPSGDPDSFQLDQHVNNLGVRADYTQRTDDRNVLKFGTQLQASQANDSFSVQFPNPPPTLNTTTGGETDRGYIEALYAQDDWTINKQWSVNAGLRMSAYQFNFTSQSTSDQQLQPRIGVNYLATPVTKLHVFYGRLFMPAPLEDLREAFNAVPGGTGVGFYDIKAEKDNYFETGVEQQVGESHVMAVNVYYKKATNMLDDTQLLNTSIASPYNYQDGYAYGIEYSVHGKLTPEISDFFNYAWEIAKGENISGGTFAVPASSIPQNTYLYLDHVQKGTANAGLSYAKNAYFGSVQALFGSGLRTGPDNTLSLPSHFTLDLTAGYDFSGWNDSWWSKCKIQGDLLNLFGNEYPITIDNGFNGSHYAAGREFFVRLTKEL
jgi:outer membrane cobalamin receptor